MKSQLLVLMCLLLIIISCAKPAPQPTPEPPPPDVTSTSTSTVTSTSTSTQTSTSTPTSTVTSTSTSTNTHVGTCVNGTWCGSYDTLVTSKLTPKMLSANPDNFCPSYASVDKTKFWLSLEKAISNTESNWDNNNVFQENFIDAATGKLALSVGLFQLSVGDKLNYRNDPTCQKMNASNLTQWDINIGCALEIQNTLITKYSGTIPTVLSAYWSSMNMKNSGDETLGYVKSYIPECFK